MPDGNPSAKAQEHATAHPCDAPGLTGTEFLYAVMHDRTLSLTTRINAAAKLMRIEANSPPRSGLTIRIGGIPDPCTATPDPQDGKIGNRQSFLCERSNNHHPHDTTPGPSNIETNTDPLSFDDIQQVKAAVQRLHPDADLSHIPDHFTLCECGHWMPFPCKCASIH